MTWWLWSIFGLALLAAELLLPTGFFVFFFGLSGVLVGALVGIGLVEDPWIEWMLFSGLAIVLLLGFRRRLVDRVQRRQRSPIDTVVGEVATLSEDLPPGAVGKAELRGSVWTVKSLEEKPLAKGQRCIVERVEGLTLWIRAESRQGEVR